MVSNPTSVPVADLAATPDFTLVAAEAGIHSTEDFERIAQWYPTYPTQVASYLRNGFANPVLTATQRELAEFALASSAAHTLRTLSVSNFGSAADWNVGGFWSPKDPRYFVMRDGRFEVGKECVVGDTGRYIIDEKLGGSGKDFVIFCMHEGLKKCFLVVKKSHQQSILYPRYLRFRCFPGLFLIGLSPPTAQERFGEPLSNIMGPRPRPSSSGTLPLTTPGSPISFLTTTDSIMFSDVEEV